MVEIFGKITLPDGEEITLVERSVKKFIQARRDILNGLRP